MRAVYQEATEMAGGRIRETTFRRLRELAHREGQPYGRLVADAIELYLADRLEQHHPVISAPDVTQLGLEVGEAGDYDLTSDDKSNEEGDLTTVR